MSEANRLSVTRRTRFGALWGLISNCSLPATASLGRKIKTPPFASITRACSNQIDDQHAWEIGARSKAFVMVADHTSMYRWYFVHRSVRPDTLPIGCKRKNLQMV